MSALKVDDLARGKALLAELVNFNDPANAHSLNDWPVARANFVSWAVDHGTLALSAASDLAAQQTWRCFHCDEVFTDKAEAREHFGTDEYKTPACRLGEVDVKALRSLEADNAELCRENERLENDARLRYESEADRIRRIGNVQWWQEMDSREGERLVLTARAESAASDLAALKAQIRQFHQMIQDFADGTVNVSGTKREAAEVAQIQAVLAVVLAESRSQLLALFQQPEPPQERER